MFDWLASPGRERGLAELDGPRYGRVRMVLDAFYALYCPDLSHEVADLCFLVEAGKYTLDAVMQRLCNRMKHYAVDVGEWEGPMFTAAIRFRLECFYLTFDRTGIDRIPGLLQHITTKRYPMTVVLSKMCEKYNVPLTEWVGDYPRALIDNDRVVFPVPKEPCALTSRRSMAAAGEGDVTTAVINDKVYRGIVVESDPGSFTVKFDRS